MSILTDENSVCLENVQIVANNGSQENQAELAEESRINLYDLPYDVLAKILGILDYKSLNSLSYVNKKLNSIANDNFIWKTKLLIDIKKWRVIDSKTFPTDLFEPIIFNSNSDNSISYKRIYYDCCPELLTKKDILKKLETFQQAQNALHLTSTSENVTASCIGFSPNLTLSSLSSLAMPMMVFSQLKDFINRNIFQNVPANDTSRIVSQIPKLVMFGPGLETTTSCLVTNILWKSDFKTIGMIPGKDGYGSGIELKLFNHKSFNLTTLYTNVSKVRSSNNHDINANRLLVSKNVQDSDELSYELQPQVKEACLDASGFIYVIDNKHLASLAKENKNGCKSDALNNYKLELDVLMKETNPDLPLLILSCSTNDQNDLIKQSTIDSLIDLKQVKRPELSCIEIIKELEIHNLKRDWQIRNCEIFQHKMKDIILGFEWVLNELDQKYMLKQTETINLQ